MNRQMLSAYFYLEFKKGYFMFGREIVNIVILLHYLLCCSEKPIGIKVENVYR